MNVAVNTVVSAGAVINYRLLYTLSAHMEHYKPCLNARLFAMMSARDTLTGHICGTVRETARAGW